MSGFFGKLKEKKFGLPVGVWAFIIAILVYLLWRHYRSSSSNQQQPQQSNTGALDSSATDTGQQYSSDGYQPQGFGTGDVPWWMQPFTLPTTTVLTPTATLPPAGPVIDGVNPSPSPTPVSTPTHTTKPASVAKKHYIGTGTSKTKHKIIPFTPTYVDAAKTHGGSIGKTFKEGNLTVQQVHPTQVGGGGKVVKGL